MEQLEFFDIPNPCSGICVSNCKGYCKGCLRSRSERLYWLRMSNVQKRSVLKLCILRRRKLLLLRQQGVVPVLTEQALSAQADFDF